MEETCPAIGHLKRWADSWSIPSLMAFCGPYGTGKTQAATLLAREALKRKIGSRYITAQGFYATLRWGGHADCYRTRLELRVTKLLVIDEVHATTDSAIEAAELRDLIDARYASEFTTILIANLSPDDLMTRLGAAIADRFVEDGVVLEFKGTSYRKDLS